MRNSGVILASPRPGAQSLIFFVGEYRWIDHGSCCRDRSVSCSRTVLSGLMRRLRNGRFFFTKKKGAEPVASRQSLLRWLCVGAASREEEAGGRQDAAASSATAHETRNDFGNAIGVIADRRVIIIRASFTTGVLICCLSLGRKVARR
jgi:hypothetical protein